jgi:hypothetical protein
MSLLTIVIIFIGIWAWLAAWGSLLSAKKNLSLMSGAVAPIGESSDGSFDAIDGVSSGFFIAAFLTLFKMAQVKPPGRFPDKETYTRNLTAAKLKVAEAKFELRFANLGALLGLFVGICVLLVTERSDALYCVECSAIREDQSSVGDVSNIPPAQFLFTVVSFGIIVARFLGICISEYQKNQ